MAGATHPGGFWEPSQPYPLLRVRARAESRCRCGSVIRAGAVAHRFGPVPGSLERLLSGREFCSVACARSFLLEARETLEASSPPSHLSDLEEVLHSLRHQLAEAELRAMGSDGRGPPA